MSIPTVKLPAHKFQTCRVGYLRKLLAKMDDDTLVVVESRDHSYRPSIPREATALWNPETGRLSDDFGDDYAAEGEVRIKVLVTS